MKHFVKKAALAISSAALLMGVAACGDKAAEDNGTVGAYEPKGAVEERAVGQPGLSGEKPDGDVSMGIATDDRTAANTNSAAGVAASDGQGGIPSAEVNAGSGTSYGGLPGVATNVDKEGEQVNSSTRTLGAGADLRLDRDSNNAGTGTTGAGAGTASGDDATARPLRADRG